MKLIEKLCSFNIHCKYINKNYNFTDIDKYIHDNFNNFSLDIQKCDGLFNPWCYIAGLHIDIIHSFWNYYDDTLLENEVCLNFIMNGFIQKHKRNILNLCLAEAKFKLKKRCFIAIVGNAPITSDQQDEINEYDIVIRTNNCNSYRNGDKLDILFYRGVRLKAATDFPFDILKQSIGAKIFHINGKDCDSDHIFKYLSKKLYFYESTTNEDIVYEKKTIKHIPSCGFLCIKQMQKLFNNSIIDLYGFGFRVLDPSYHNLIFEKETILHDPHLVHHKPDKSNKIHHYVEHEK